MPASMLFGCVKYMDYMGLSEHEVRNNSQRGIRIMFESFCLFESPFWQNLNRKLADFPMNYGGFPVFPRNQSHPRRPVWLLSLRRSLKVELLACHWAVGKMSCFEMERKQPKNMD
jgi:hypothetical protein